MTCFVVLNVFLMFATPRQTALCPGKPEQSRPAKVYIFIQNSTVLYSIIHSTIVHNFKLLEYNSLLVATVHERVLAHG